MSMYPRDGDSYEALTLDIRAIIETKGFTLRQLSQRTHYSTSALSTALRAKSRLSPDMATRLTQALGVGHARWIDRAKNLKLGPFVPATTRPALMDDDPVADNLPRVSAARPGSLLGVAARSMGGLVVNGDGNVVHNVAPSWAPPPPDPSGASTPQELNELLHELRTWAGSPSLRRLEQNATDLSRATVSDMLNQPDRLPKRGLLQAYVSACGAASEWPRWNMAWQTASSFLRRQREREVEARRRLASNLAARTRGEAMYPVDANVLLNRMDRVD